MPTISPDSTTWDKNLFAYCDNNPVTRKDDEGQYWNIVTGALIGAAINTTMAYITAMAAGTEFTLKDALIAAGSGALSGALAATGAGQFLQAIGGAIIGATTSAVDDITHGRHIDAKRLSISAGIGFVGGMLGGHGIRHKDGSLMKAKSTMDKLAQLSGKGVKKAVTQATSHYETVYALESMKTLGKFYGASLLSNAFGRLFTK